MTNYLEQNLSPLETEMNKILLNTLGFVSLCVILLLFFLLQSPNRTSNHLSPSSSVVFLATSYYGHESLKLKKNK